MTLPQSRNYDIGGILSVGDSHKSLDNIRLCITIPSMKSLCCNSNLVLRDRDNPFSKRRLPKGSREVLLKCSLCGAKHQCREGDYSHPYRTKTTSQLERRTVTIIKRLKPSRVSEIEAEWKSVGFFLENAPAKNSADV